MLLNGYVINIQVVYLNKEYFVEGKPLVVNASVEFGDLITRKLTDAERQRYLEDEAAYINDFAEEMKRRVSKNYISEFMSKDYKAVFSERIYSSLEALTSQEINNVLVSALTPMQDYGSPKKEMLYAQVPFPSFIYYVEDGKPSVKVDTYLWFLNFVYFLRNALFHEIIDPLDEFWQDLFKHSYLALKEILDGNINYFLEKSVIDELLFTRAWNEILTKKEIYVPNFDETNYKGHLETAILDYKVDENTITIKATMYLDYWYDAHSQKRMNAKCKATIIRSTKEVSRFKMEFEKLTDVPEGD